MLCVLLHNDNDNVGYLLMAIHMEWYAEMIMRVSVVAIMMCIMNMIMMLISVHVMHGMEDRMLNSNCCAITNDGR